MRHIRSIRVTLVATVVAAVVAACASAPVSGHTTASPTAAKPRATSSVVCGSGQIPDNLQKLVSDCKEIVDYQNGKSSMTHDECEAVRRDYANSEGSAIPSEWGLPDPAPACRPAGS